MGDFRITGSCQCRAVRYAVTAPADEMDHCHCSICRKSFAAMFGTFATVSRDAFHIEAGEDNLTDYEEAPGVTKRFCRTCGAAIMLVPDRMHDKLWYSPATLDGDDPGHPRETEKHIFVASQQPWWRIRDDLPKFDEMP